MPSNQPSVKLPRDNSMEEVVMQEHLAELRGRVMLLTWVSGVAWTLLALIGGLLVTGTLDWLIHLDDSGTRLVLGLGLLGGSSWMLWRRLIAPLRVRLTGSFLASRVEKQFPGLESRVLSAVEFLEHRFDEKIGSAELQQAVVKRALKDLERIEPSDIVDTNSIRNITLAGLSVCFVALVIVLFSPIEAAIAIERLAMPFARIPWPRAVELQLVQGDLTPVNLNSAEPFLVARGDTLELYVRNTRGRLPERVWFEYRDSEDGPVIRETLRQTSLRDEAGKAYETAAIHWVATRGPLYFRASGGDDNVMPFYRVDVVPPPTIQKLQVTVTPPAYSQQPVEILPPGVGHVQGLVGTRVKVEVTSDKPLKSARLRMGEQPGVPIAIAEDGCQLTATFEIKEAFATNYWFELTDLQGFTDREAVRYELRGIADIVPEVSIESPLSDVLLTADAELTVQILAKDDLRLKEGRITYQIGDDAKLSSIPLFDRTAPAGEPDVEHVAPPESNDRTEPGPQRLDLKYVWKISDLKLEPGARIVFRGEATDDYDLGQPHVGRSVPRRITIVSGGEKQQELASRVGELLDDLQQATQLQQRARQQTHELQAQLDKVGELRSQDVDQLGRTELDQRQAASRLTNPTDGVETQARQLLDELRSNHLKDEGAHQRLERVANELERLAREEFPEAEQSLTRAQKLVEQQSGGGAKSARPPAKDGAGSQSAKQTPGKTAKAGHPEAQSESNSSSSGSADPEHPESPVEQPKVATSDAAEMEAKSEQTPPSGEKSLESALADAEARQSRALESLKDLEDSLAEWRDRRDVSRDLDSVMAEQEAIQKDATELSQQTMSKSSAELTRQEQAELDKLSLKQNKIAEQLDQFRKQLQQAAGSLQKNDPETSEKFNEAGQELSKLATASKLREAAEEIAENKMGEAAQAQQQALEELRDIVRMMKQQPQQDTEQFLKQTDEALQDFQQLRQEQQQLADQFQKLSEQPDSSDREDRMRELMEKQQDLTQRMVKAERKLERLRLHGPAESMHRARKRANDLLKQLPEANDADEMQEALEDVLDELEQAEQELVLEKRIAQERLAFEQLEKIEDELKGLKTRQQAVIDETTRLEGMKTERETLTRGQLKTLKELAETERSLQHVAEQLQQQMATAEIFSLVLKRLGRTLMLAADRLGERDTGDATQTLENDAIRKIDSLLAVLKQEQKKQQQNQPQEKPEQLGQEPQEQEEKPEEAQPQGQMIPQLAQLKLLKSLQEEYLERTELLDKFRDGDGKLPAAMEAEMAELAREQAELADYARNLVAKFLQQQPERGPAADDKPKPQEEPDGPDPTKIEP